MLNLDTLLFERDELYKELDTALKMVRNFVKTNKLILVGGQAIDYAMRAKGSKLYSGDEIPDYDFYSSDHYQDAIELGNNLCDAGLPSISIIYAMHVTAIRVRVNSVAVADIKYCPKTVLDTIPTISYQGLSIVHPHVQMIDQHRALSYGYEVMFKGGTAQRWGKDADRWAMIEKLYPITMSGDVKSQKVTLSSIVVPLKILSGVAIGGYAAHAIYDGADTAKISGTNLEFKVRQKSLVLLTDTYEETIDKVLAHYKEESKSSKKSKQLKAQHFNAFLGRLPRRAEIQTSNMKIVIMDNLGSYLAAQLLSQAPAFAEMKRIPEALSTTYIVSAQFILMQYLNCGDICSYQALIDTPYIQPVSTYYGIENTDESYKFSLLKMQNPQNSRMLPKRLYLEDGVCGATGHFDYESEFFQIDGAPIEEA